MLLGHIYASLLLIPGKAKRRLESMAHVGADLSMFGYYRSPAMSLDAHSKKGLFLTLG